MPCFVGICGNGYEAGKTTFANSMAGAFGRLGYMAKVVAFAEPIKAAALLLETAYGGGCISESDKGKDEKPYCFCGKTRREVYQTLGTEWGRNCIAEDFWIRLLFNRYRGAELDFVIIDDMRFHDELAAVKTAGGYSIFVWRDSAVQNGHVSEGRIPSYATDLFVNNNADLIKLDATAASFADEVARRHDIATGRRGNK